MQAYTTGRGSILMRAQSAIETNKKGDRISIVFTEIPYQVNKAKLIERIADLVREKTIEGISDLRDESDRDGMRIVIELKRGEVPEVVLNNLYKHTPLQSSFGIIMLAIVGGRPKVLNLLELIESFVEFRREVVRRRTEFELRKAEARYHILEGLKIALDHLDAVIKLIRGSKTVAEARDGLMTSFGLSQIQAQAILDMQLQRLTGLERQKILDELAELLKTIERLRAILASERLLMQIIVDELREVREQVRRRSPHEIIEGESGELSIEDLIAEEDMAITVSNTGYIKRTAISTYRNQRRGGKGRIGMRTRDEDFVSHLFVASTHAYIMIFSDRGRAYWLKVHEIPDVGPGGKGKSIANLVSMEEGEKIAAMLAVKEFDDAQFVVMGTRKGVVKKTALSAFSNPRAGGIIAMGVEEGDAVIAVQVTDGTAEMFIGTRNGMAIRFPETDVRPMGRTAYGVRGITLRDDDYVVAMEVVRPGGTLLTVTEHGFGKRTEIDEYRVQSRGGVGIINIATTIATARSSASPTCRKSDELLLITQQGMILRMQTNDVRAIGRATQGVRLIDIEGDDKVVSIAKLAERRRGRSQAPRSEQEAVCAGRSFTLAVALTTFAACSSPPEAADPAAVLPRVAPERRHVTRQLRDDQLPAADTGLDFQLRHRQRVRLNSREPLRLAAVVEEVEGVRGRRSRVHEAQGHLLPGESGSDHPRAQGGKPEGIGRWQGRRGSGRMEQAARGERSSTPGRSPRRSASSRPRAARFGSASTTRRTRSTSTKRTGELVSKDVTITANVRTPDWRERQPHAGRDDAVEAVLQGEPAVEGKWIITGVRDATAPAGGKRRRRRS